MLELFIVFEVFATLSRFLPQGRRPGLQAGSLPRAPEAVHILSVCKDKALGASVDANQCVLQYLTFVEHGAIYGDGPVDIKGKYWEVSRAQVNKSFRVGKCVNTVVNCLGKSMLLLFLPGSGF